jgi:hypothetical protein
MVELEEEKKGNANCTLPISQSLRMQWSTWPVPFDVGGGGTHSFSPSFVKASIPVVLM